MSGPGWYSTSYAVHADELLETANLTPVGAYGGYLWARNARHAKALAKRRGLNERIISAPSKVAPYLRPSTLLAKRRPNMINVIHGAMYLGWIASRAQITTGTRLIADAGLLHELAHYAQFGEDRRRGFKDSLVVRLQRLERKTPGYWPPE